MNRLAEWKVARENRKGTSPTFNYVAAGKYHQALDRLELALEAHDPNMPYIGVMWKFADLHDEPRFQDLLRRMNFPEDVLAGYLNETR